MFPEAAALLKILEDLGRDLYQIMPEATVGLGIVLILLARITPGLQKINMISAGIMIAAVAFALDVLQWFVISDASVVRIEAFTQMIVIDSISVLTRGFLLLFAIYVLFLSRLTGMPEREDSADYTVLVLGGILGMMFMSSANHLVMMFLAIEMASLPSYVLSGFVKNWTKGSHQFGSESALKYVVYGAAASGTMLYGMSLLAGRYGTGDFSKLSFEMAMTLSKGGVDLALATGILLFLVGFGFKLAAVPFHAWLPDVFEGASAEVGAILSVASKAAAIALLSRILLGMQDTLLIVLKERSDLYLQSVGVGLAIIAAMTATLGNLCALAQTNMKRLLGYSTIAHAGYMLMALSCLSHTGVSAVLYYLLAYFLMNLGAFAVVALVRQSTGSEELDAYTGLLQRSPWLAVAMIFFLMSLLGLPPLAGFAGKFQIFQAVFTAGAEHSTGDHRWISTVYFTLLGIGILNTVVSAGYYLKIVKRIGLEETTAVDEKGQPIELQLAGGTVPYLLTLVAGILAVGVLWTPIVGIIHRAVGM